MPQARKDGNPHSKTLEKESKRARGALSCAECRRLKLKCDKTVPCSSCKRRGCEAICPNGSLITGQGTRFVLADTEKLHQKIAHMSDRIRQLEDAVAILQSTLSNEPHPLLSRELLTIKSSIELHAAVGQDTFSGQRSEDESESAIDAFGTLAIRDDGAATFYGRSAGSEVASSTSSFNMSETDSIAALSASFPLGTNSFQSIHVDMDYLLSHHLPQWEDAWKLAQLYLEQAPWFFGAVTKKHLMEEILPMWYYEARGFVGVAHDLSLLFMIFCFGALTDISLPPTPENALSEHYYQLTKASLVLEPVLERPPSVATVQALSLMAIYEGICSREGSIERTWSLFGLAGKLAQSIGLHRDCARWKLSPAEVQKRRALFWELFITDGWQSLATGRLATFSLPFVDCELPQDLDSIIAEDGSTQPSFPYWKARFGAECVSAVVQGTLTSRAPKYSIILDLDRKVRDMELPLYAQQAQNLVLALGETMSRFMPINYRELTLLYIHRCFFAHAISTNPADPIKSQYAPSFLAGYRSACTILGSVKQQFWLFPRQIARFWVLWTHAFSATVSCVMLASVATHVSKQSQVAHAAMIELRNACELFESAAKHGGRAVKFLSILQRLRTKAQKSFDDDAKGLPPEVLNDVLKPSKMDEEKNELEIFSGKTHTVATRMKATGVRRMNSNGSLASSRASSGSPQAITGDGLRGQGHLQVPGQVQSSSTTSQSQSKSQPAAQPPPAPLPSSSSSPSVLSQQQPQLPLMNEYPSFQGVHPSLVHELRGFDGRIEAQVRQDFLNQNGLYRMDGSVIGGEEEGQERGEGEGEGQQRGGVGVGDEGGANNNMVGVEFQEQQRREMEYQVERRREEEEARRMVEMERRERDYEMQRSRPQHQQSPSPLQHQHQQQEQQQYHATYLPQEPQFGEGYYDQIKDEGLDGRHPIKRVSQLHRQPSPSSLRQAYGPETVYDYQHQHRGTTPVPGPSSRMQYHHQQQQPQHHQHHHSQAPQQQQAYSAPSSTASMSPYEAHPPTAYPQPQPQQSPHVQYSHSPPPHHHHHQQQQQPQQQPMYSQDMYSHYWAAAPIVQDQQNYPTHPHHHHHQQQPPPPSAPQQQQHFVQYPDQYSGGQQQIHPGHIITNQHLTLPQHQQQQQQQRYTPAGVLRGIVADDSGLQETWTAYMNNVALPKSLFED
ncbi:hypothetical protein AGABI1DRAFT_121521 [Agaricus bisporus var. burnettii JB137-S8]|uniref:Zn(2)-C6 fungal-type domain-containing protein n=1 Tax=Agaricus bisporus var. burnettii (strain JB137-S8 / ATCC MYA-4627 / FGSC 10392) TaxID=597362 RepID=K5WSP3_AGABU|nr:uncharacterized protein AGABI1DRAFT_121521 [Agaricus bisporus var. burnettii JB137-S8]EKM78436.1 hypothetical protein AGABI1DRAFT_121521 [Agaricus bisporus var. burnettii JB137-S8]